MIGRLGQGSYAQPVSNDATLQCNPTSAQALSGVLSGSGVGSLQKSNSGTLTLTGANTSTGGTTVAAGELRINGSIASSAVAVASGTALSGSGRVGAISETGSLNPGQSPGSLTVNSVDLSSGLDFNFEFTFHPGWAAQSAQFAGSAQAIDGFSLELTTVPEPQSSAFLLGLAAGLLVLMRRRRARSA